MRKGITIGVVASLVVIVATLAFARAAVFSAVLPRIISLVTGYDIAFGEVRLERDHATLLHVRVARAGEPVLDAARVEIDYSLADLLPGSKHRYGVSAISIDHPTLTLVKHREGSYNVTFPQSGGPAPIGPVSVNHVPIAMTIRIRDGELDVRAPFALDPQSRSLRARGVNLDAQVDTGALTRYRLQGRIVERSDVPVTASGTIDVKRGYAMHHAYAAAVPLRAIANYFIDSNAARILTGTATNFDARIYALDVTANRPIDYHISGGLDVSGGALAIEGLAKPVRNIDGALQLVDGAFFANKLRGTLAGAPVNLTGGIYDFTAPQYRIGLSTRGDLKALRTIFQFSQTQPVTGTADSGVLIEGALASPIVVADVIGSRVGYGGAALHDVHAKAAFASDTLLLAPVRVRASGADISVSGAIAANATAHSQLVLHVSAPADRLPYAGELLGAEPLVADALFNGHNGTFSGQGALASARGVERAAANFTFSPQGTITVAPFWVHTQRGAVDGAYLLDRSHDSSSFWLLADAFTMRASQHASFLDSALPRMPPIDAHVGRVALEGGGRSGTGAVVAGTVAAQAMRIAGVTIDSLDARFAGTVADAGIQPLRASGPWGTIDGRGGYANNALVVRGDYRGNVSELRPFLGDAPAQGTVDGPVAVSIAPDRTTIQSDNLMLHGAAVRGVPISHASVTLSVAAGVVRVYSAHAHLAGGDAVAAGSYDTGARQTSTSLSLVAVGLDGARLKGLGLPLDAGKVDLDGKLAAQIPLPKFDGVVAIAHGRVAKYRVAGSGIVHLGENAAQLTAVVGALDGTYALANGTLSTLASGYPAYALQANVPAGDVARALHTFELPAFASDGTFNASLSVGGHGLQPTVRGSLRVPAGSVNGLPFIDGAAEIAADRSGVIARRGSVQVGSTKVLFGAAKAPFISGLRVRASDAHLADFNNFFDTGDTLHGTGSVLFDVVSQHKRISSNGRIDVKAFGYRNLAIGDTSASWSSARNVLRGALSVGGASGTLHARGSIALAPELEWTRVVRDSRYDLALGLGNVDLSTWISALGFPEVPITGRIDGNANIAGTYPRMNMHGSAGLKNATAWRLPIQRLAVAFSSNSSRIRVDKADLAAPGIDADASGSFALDPRAPLDLDVHATSNDLPELIAQLTRIQVPVTGAFESTVHVGGNFAAPTFAAAFDATDVDAYNVKIPSAFGSVRLLGRSLQLRNAGIAFERGDVTIAGTLPLQLFPFGVGPPDAPVSFDLGVNGVDPSDFEALLGNQTKLGGTLDGVVGLSGTVSQPRISGRLDVAKGSYASDFERTPVSDISGTLAFNGTAAVVQKLHALFGSGTLDASGRIVFPNGFTNGTAGGAAYSLNAVARGAQFDLPAYGRGSVDAKIALARTIGHEASLSGTAGLTDAVIPFATFLAAGQNEGEPAGLPLALGFNLEMTAGKNVRVRGGGFGGGLDIGAAGAAHLGGDVAAPTLDGLFTSTGGTLTYFDRAFRVQSASVAFTPSAGIIPVIHATGTTHVVNPDPDTSRNPYGSAEIAIMLDGPVNNLKVAFDSTPAGYSKEQIIAMIAPFGGFINGIGYTPGFNAPSGTDVAQLGQLAPVPGSTLRNQTGTISVGQEAFNLLNAQFTAGLLGPLENAITQGLGFQDVNLTFDYYGNVGFSARRLLGRTVSFVYASTFGLPTRQSFGLELQGSEATSAALSFFFQNGPTRLLESPRSNFSSNGRLSVGEALTGENGFSFTLQRLYW